MSDSVGIKFSKKYTTSGITSDFTDCEMNMRDPMVFFKTKSILKLAIIFVHNASSKRDLGTYSYRRQ